MPSSVAVVYFDVPAGGAERLWKAGYRNIYGRLSLCPQPKSSLVLIGVQGVEVNNGVAVLVHSAQAKDASGLVDQACFGDVHRSIQSLCILLSGSAFPFALNISTRLMVGK